MFRKTALALLVTCMAGPALADNLPKTTTQTDTKTTVDTTTRGASADSLGQGGGVEFTKLDTDMNGSLSRDEVKASASVSAKLADLDKDGDGKITRGEFAAAEAKAKTPVTDTKVETKTETKTDTKKSGY